MDNSYESIAATPGGGQASWPNKGATFTRLTPVASPGDSLTLPKAGPGLNHIIINKGANYANIFPAKGEQIGALGVNVPFALWPGQLIDVLCTTTGVWDLVQQPTNIVTFGASGTYTPTPGMVSATVYVVPAGGGGEGGALGAAPNGAPQTAPGMAGVLVYGTFSAAQIGASQPVVVGTGGLGGAPSSTAWTRGGAGGNGGASSFGSWLSSPGGVGGRAVAPGGNIIGAYTTFSDILVNMWGRSAGGVGNAIYPAVPSAVGSPGCYAGGSFLSGGAAGAIGGPGGAGQSVSLSAGGVPFELFMGSGGGSGGGSASVGGAGGSGGWPGGAGGAGGNAYNGGTAGAGGRGADGFVIVVERF